MFNVTDLISSSDFFILFIYAILVYYILRSVVFRKMDMNHNRLLTVFFILKVFCAMLMSTLLVFYWGVSDNIDYFIETKNFVRLIKTDFSNIKYFFLPVESYNEKIKFDNEMVSSANSLGVESNFLVIKFQTLLYPFSFGKYLILNFLFSVIATIGQFKFFLVLSKRYPHIKRNVAVAVLLMPSVLLYSSYINKETLCMAFMGFAFYHFFYLIRKQNRITHALLLVFYVFLIGILKIYILAAFFASVGMVYFIKLVAHYWRGSILSKIFISIFLAIVLWVFLSNLELLDPYVVDFAEKSNFFQEQYNSMDQTSSFEFGELETSFAGVLQKAPLGIYTTYFRPHLWEVNKPIILFSALESFIVLLITISALVFRRKNIRSFMKADIFANISFYYVLIFGVIVGLTTFNFGSLIRYKIPAVPFLMMFVFLLLHYKKNDEGKLKV